MMALPTPEVDPAASARPPHWQTWRVRVRWFAGEFLVVVAGVLTALAMQSWYQARQDAAAASTYLSQLKVDLEATQEMLETAVVEDSLRAEANAWLLDALRNPVMPTPESSSRLRLRLGYYSDPRPVLGTVSTLIETGDIRLIRDPRLRSRIVAYASLMATDAEELSRHVNRLISASDAERLQWAKDGLDSFALTGTTTQSEVAGTYSEDGAERLRQSYASVWRVLHANPELRAALSVRQIAFASRVFYLRRMVSSTEELRSLLDES
jgi:hypothetical protein